jgi:hypothetical protein
MYTRMPTQSKRFVFFWVVEHCHPSLSILATSTTLAAAATTTTGNNQKHFKSYRF